MAEEEDAVYRILAASSPVTALVAGRVYPDRASSAALPYVVYSRVSGVPDLLIEGGASFDRYRVQVDCYAATKTAARALAIAVRAAIEAEGYCIGVNPSNFKEDTKTFSDSRDYSLIESR